MMVSRNGENISMPVLQAAANISAVGIDDEGCCNAFKTTPLRE